MRPLRLLFSLLSVSILLSCTSDSSSSPSLLRILPHLETRVTALDFDPGDVIGVTVERPTGVYASNAALTYDGRTFVSSDVYWYPARTEPSTLTAYYPYSSSGRPSRFTIASDQRTDLSLSDLLVARSTDVLPSGSAIPMLFRHVLSQLTVVVTNESGSTVSSLSLSGLCGTSEIDWDTLTATRASDGSTVTVRPYPTPEGYSAILVPQQGTLTVSVTTTNGRSYDRSVTVDLRGGLRYRLALTLHSDTLSLVLSGTIEDWTAGGDLVPSDPTPPQEPDTPQPSTLTIGTEVYRLRRIGLSTWMSENLRTIPATASLGSGIWSPYGGDHRSGYLYDASSASSQCPAGWHLPTSEELSSLIGADTGTGFYEEGGLWKHMLSQYGEKSYLLGARSTETESYVLQFTSSGGESVKELSSQNGYSVRFVQDR